MTLIRCASIALFLLAGASAPAQTSILGFTPASAAREAEIEAKLKSGLPDDTSSKAEAVEQKRPGGG